MNYLIIIVLVGLSAIFSGLTLGFFSLNTGDIKRKADLGDKRALKIYPVRKKGNLLLCTLLIGNVAVNSALSIFLGSITAGGLALLIATSLIVILGEILPQASFSRYAMQVGPKFVWLVKIFIFILYPVCLPLAWLLDKILGEEIPTIYSKKELIKIVEEHEDHVKSPIDADEERIIKGALSYSQKTVRDIMIPADQVVLLKYNQRLDHETIDTIRMSGHSRIPVYKKMEDKVVGIFYVKDLLRHHWSGKRVGEVARRDVVFVRHYKPLDDLLNDFKKTRRHLFVVLGKQDKFLGIVTVEDVIEEIIGAEIYDEFDKGDK